MAEQCGSLAERLIDNDLELQAVNVFIGDGGGAVCDSEDGDKPALS